MLYTLPGSLEERILVEALARLGTLEGLEVQTREELEVHFEIIKLKVWRSLPHLSPPQIPVEDDHIPYVVVYSFLSTK